jgi:hypothetical protein
MLTASLANTIFYNTDAAPCAPPSGALPVEAMASALLLQPALIDRLLDAVARDCCSGGHNGSSGGTSSGGRGGSSRAASISEALAGHPVWPRLPQVLASQPAIFCRVRVAAVLW